MEMEKTYSGIHVEKMERPILVGKSKTFFPALSPAVAATAEAAIVMAGAAVLLALGLSVAMA